MKIYLPHIHYTISVRDIKKAKMDGFVGKAMTEKIDKNNCILWLPYPIKASGTVFHEIVHVLQFICESRHIDFVLEQEHLGYIAQYISNRLLGLEYF